MGRGKRRDEAKQLGKGERKKRKAELILEEREVDKEMDEAKRINDLIRRTNRGMNGSLQ